ncbi:cell surface protein SprA [Rapidithrix thailandica]|uniref:Cell surface protein SprA n=1 Tax=Rapidithrix thailandica TaxID=413964 RepID=A0AAW9S5F1_9BACT
MNWFIYFKSLLISIAGFAITYSAIPADHKALTQPSPSPAFYQEVMQDTVKKDTTKKVKAPSYASDRRGDPISNYFSPSPLLLRTPSNVNFSMELDTSGTFYRLSEKLGPYDYRYRSKIPFDSYKDFKYRQLQRDYWKRISMSQDGGDNLPGDDSDRLIPLIELGPIANRLFGGSQIDIRTNGNLVLDFGGLWQRVNNPQLPIRQQRNGGFNFDQQINMSLTGKIGEKLEINTNVNTENTFQFEQKYNINYTAFEEDIIQEVQAGNLSFPVSNSLITGAQNLFGVSTKLRFGKLWVNAVVSSSRGTSEQITIKNGAQSREFELRADEYDVNRHFFLSQFFRDNFENNLRSLPVLTSNITINRLQVYVTNRNNNTQTLRNVVGMLDLGEGTPYSNNPLILPGIPGPASNNSNALFANISSQSGVRNPDEIVNTLEAANFTNGEDFELLRGARRLEDNEFTFHPQLGYVSLTTPLRNDEVLMVAYEYRFNGQAYKVGELNEDLTEHSESDVTILKLLKPSTIRTDLPTWDLMMKNIYPLQANSLERENFQFRIIYRDDRTGLDNPSLHEGIRTKDIPLVRIMNLDRLNQNNDPQPDGNFDFVEGITIDPVYGRIIFPVLEPFGSHLESYFDPGTENQLINKYIYTDLYNKTQADAALNTSKNKFFLMGSYQSGSSNEIVLPGINIAPNSVVVRAGNIVLQEGTDYMVDYQIGRVRIINEGVMNSGKEIKIQYERADLFNFQTRNLLGLDLKYELNKNVSFTGTLLHLSEKPIISRVTIGNEPVKNTLWGFGVNYQTESRLLTKMVDALPFLSTKKESNISFQGEFAQLIPGSPKLIGENGTSYLDDFEGAEVPYSLASSPVKWALGTVPDMIAEQTPNTDPLSYNFKRAKLAWYSIDNIFYGSRSPSGTKETINNHYIRAIPFNEIFQNRDREQIVTNERSFDLAYFPAERGPYNYNPDLDAEGNLKNPEENFGAITQAITNDVDFDNINIQYIEFWLMDPFMEGENGRQITGATANTGGDLYINLGNISEDLIPDNRHFFENGLTSSPDGQAQTDFGQVPTQQYLTNAFDVTNPREVQDVGFDGLGNEAENAFYQDLFINNLPGSLTAAARQAIIDDPSADDFQYYLGGELDDANANVLSRYKNFNGPDGNSPENTGSTTFTPSSTTIPDNEDLNRDNTLSQLNNYYQYRVQLPSGQLANHRYVVDQVDATAPETGEQVTWYQFRIPIREPEETVGNIDGFKSIRYIRLFLTGWEQPVVLRMVNLQMKGAQWRPFTGNTRGPEPGETPEPSQAKVSISTVNIEENGTYDGLNTPYVLPPGVQRDYDATSTVTRQLNEQSIQMCIENLEDNQFEAIYKNVNFDLINYKRVKMFIHAESDLANDGDLTAVIRLGTDFESNYYEVELPLKLTPRGSTLPDVIWPSENNLDIPLDALYQVKAERNQNRADRGLKYTSTYDQYTVSVIGNPDVSSLQTIMLGVRNPKTSDKADKSVCVWFNELRVTDFDKSTGWATNASLNMQLADFATVSTNVRYSSVGFGGIQDRIADLSRSESLDFDISSNIQLDKILFNKIGLSLPLYVSFERRTVKPYYDPLDPDMPLELSALSKGGQSYIDLVQDTYKARSFNLTNVKKQKLNPDANSNFWDIENFSLDAAYSDSYLRNSQIESLVTKNWRLGATYSYNSKAKPWEPFKNVKVFKGKYFRLIRDFNLNLIPSNTTVRWDLDRKFRRTQFRNENLETTGIDPTFEKTFIFNRVYNLQWSLSKNLGLQYNANAFATIDEPLGNLDTPIKRDSVWQNIRNLGRLKRFDQTIGLTYRVPLDKIPALDWVNVDSRYNTTYSWVAGAVGLADTLGNTAQNKQSITVNGKVDFTKLYNKVPYLKKINTQSSRRRSRRPVPAEDPYQVKKQKLEKKIRKVDDRINKWYERKKKKEQKMRERGVEVEIDSAKIDPLHLFSKKEKLEGKLEKVVAEIARRKAENIQPRQNKLAKGLTKTAMMVKNVSVSYSENNATTLPGFLPQPKLLGFDEQWDSPGLPFILGSQNLNIKNKAADNNWLARNEVQTLPIMQTTNKQFSIKSDVEPFNDFKIQFEAKKITSASYSEIYRFVEDENQFETQSPTRTGNYGITYLLLNTAFTKDNDDNSSDLFQDFIDNRNVIKARLDAQNPNGEYDLNSQDVLIPSFLAAYTGKDPSKQKLSSFPQIPLPNWKVTYNGLSRVPLFEDLFKSVTISHGYVSEFSIGSYNSTYLYGASAINLDVKENDTPMAEADSTGKLVPVFTTNQVTLFEQFAPLVGVNVRTQNDFTFNVQFRKTRDMALNLTNFQVTEIKSNDVQIDIGFKKSGIRLPFRIQGITHTLKNDLDFRFAFVLRDTKTTQRKIEEPDVVTAGNLQIQIRPTVGYNINKRAKINFYFERNINDPRVSNSFRRTNTAFGVQLQYGLTQ